MVLDSYQIQKYPLSRAYSKSSGFASKFTACVWTEGVSGKKNLRNQKYADTCQRGLSEYENHINLCTSTVILTCSSDIHSYNNRFSDVANLYVNKSRQSFRLNSLSIFRAKLWNCLKPDLRKLRKKPFKNKIQQFSLAVLGDGDGCVEVSTFINLKNYKLALSHPNHYYYFVMFHVFL